MGDKTGIIWTDSTWNPLIGCSLKSDGCKHCYAMKVAHRFQGAHEHYKGTTKLTKFGPHWTGVVNQAPLGIIEQPLRWTRPRMVFVNSMSDLFHESVPFEFVAAIFGIMASCPQHTFQVLTKRPERMLEFLTVWLPRFAYEQRDVGAAPSELHACLRAAFDLLGGEDGIPKKYREALDVVWREGNEMELWPLPNVWLGTSIEDQRAADERLLTLLQVPAAIRWVSAEPLLGPVTLGLLGTLPGKLFPGYQMVWQRLHWVVVGGESGPGAREMKVEWATDLQRECREAQVPFLMKQLGKVLAKKVPGSDNKGTNMEVWPEEMRVREYPEAA